VEGVRVEGSPRVFVRVGADVRERFAGLLWEIKGDEEADGG
jgi:hypothetical protein